MWNEAKENSLEECVTNCQNSENICKQILEILAEAKCDEDSAKITWCIDYLAKLRSLGRLKIDQITLSILEGVEKFIIKSEEEKVNLQGKSNNKYIRCID